MPSDITGTDVLEEDRTTGKRALRFVRGPVFTNLLLADEINRTLPKTQAALPQAMQERAVTASGHTMRLESPFLVFATQNPIEQEGTYPLPEAQQDRFMLSVPVGYPSFEEEEEIRRTTVGEMRHAERVISGEELVAYQRLLWRLPANSRRGALLRAAVGGDAAGLGARRHPADPGRRPAREPVPRAVGARTWAALRGNEVPTREDVRAIAPAAPRHRILLNFRGRGRWRRRSTGSWARSWRRSVERRSHRGHALGRGGAGARAPPAPRGPDAHRVAAVGRAPQQARRCGHRVRRLPGVPARDGPARHRLAGLGPHRPARGRWFETETELPCTVVLDLSGDLGTGEAGRARQLPDLEGSKAGYAITLAATLLYFLHRHGEPVGLGFVAGDGVSFRSPPPRTGRNHLQLAFPQLASAAGRGGRPAARAEPRGRPHSAAGLGGAHHRRHGGPGC
ncbi:MAG: AAA family ATPase [Myxococcota bacterium]